jgi:hypothetical protein
MKSTFYFLVSLSLSLPDSSVAVHRFITLVAADVVVIWLLGYLRCPTLMMGCDLVELASEVGLLRMGLQTVSLVCSRVL